MGYYSTSIVCENLCFFNNFMDTIYTIMVSYDFSMWYCFGSLNDKFKLILSNKYEINDPGINHFFYVCIYT